MVLMTSMTGAHSGVFVIFIAVNEPADETAA